MPEWDVGCGRGRAGAGSGGPGAGCRMGVRVWVVGVWAGDGAGRGAGRGARARGRSAGTGMAPGAGARVAGHASSLAHGDRVSNERPEPLPAGGATGSARRVSAGCGLPLGVRASLGVAGLSAHGHSWGTLELGAAMAFSGCGGWPAMASDLSLGCAPVGRRTCAETLWAPALPRGARRSSQGLGSPALL